MAPPAADVPRLSSSGASKRCSTKEGESLEMMMTALLQEFEWVSSVMVHQV